MRYVSEITLPLSQISASETPGTGLKPTCRSYKGPEPDGLPAAGTRIASPNESPAGALPAAQIPDVETNDEYCERCRFLPDLGQP